MNGLGEVIGPLFGAQMYERVGFRMTSDLTAIVAFAYVLTFFAVTSRGPRHRASSGEDNDSQDLKNEFYDGEDCKDPKA